MQSRTAALSQASTLMPSSYDKNTTLGGEGKCDKQANLSLHAPLLNITHSQVISKTLNLTKCNPKKNLREEREITCSKKETTVVDRKKKIQIEKIDQLKNKIT